MARRNRRGVIATPGLAGLAPGTFVLGDAATGQAVNGDYNVDSVYAYKFTAAVAVPSGSSVSFRHVISAVTGTPGLQLSLWTDSTGTPASRIALATIASPVAGTTNVNATLSGAIVLGTSYWLAGLITGVGDITYPFNITAGSLVFKASVTGQATTPSSWPGTNGSSTVTSLAYKLLSA